MCRQGRMRGNFVEKRERVNEEESERDEEGEEEEEEEKSGTVSVISKNKNSAG